MKKKKKYHKKKPVREPMFQAAERARKAVRIQNLHAATILWVVNILGDF